MPATIENGKKSGKKEKYELAVSRMSDLPTIPNTLLRIWQIVDDPDSSASDLEKVITMDQALSAKLIRLVNSPYYGARESVVNCGRAITLLGFSSVKNLSVCVSVVSAFLPDSEEKHELDLGELWKHSAATGIIAQKVAQLVGGVDTGTAFTAGVLHDIGKFVLHLCLRDEYSAVVKTAREKGIRIRDAEEDLIGANHTYFGGKLAVLWGFPEELQDVIGRHHDFGEGAGPVCLAEVVQHADRIARSLRIGSSGDEFVVDVRGKSMSRLGLSGKDAEEFLSEANELVADAQALMNLV